MSRFIFNKIIIYLSVNVKFEKICVENTLTTVDHNLQFPLPHRQRNWLWIWERCRRQNFLNLNSFLRNKVDWKRPHILWLSRICITMICMVFPLSSIVRISFVCKTSAAYSWKTAIPIAYELNQITILLVWIIMTQDTG